MPTSVLQPSPFDDLLSTPHSLYSRAQMNRGDGDWPAHGAVAVCTEGSGPQVCDPRQRALANPAPRESRWVKAAEPAAAHRAAVRSVEPVRVPAARSAHGRSLHEPPQRASGVSPEDHSGLERPEWICRRDVGSMLVHGPDARPFQGLEALPEPERRARNVLSSSDMGLSDRAAVCRIGEASKPRA
jgi:hypothetical protein